MREENYIVPASRGIFYGAFGQDRSEATVRFRRKASIIPKRRKRYRLRKIDFAGD